MKQELAERLAVLKSIIMLIRHEIEFTKDVTVIRIEQNSRPELLNQNLRDPFDPRKDLEGEAVIEHIFDMGKIYAYEKLSYEIQKSIKNIEYEDEINE